MSFESVEFKKLSKCPLCGGKRVKHIVKEGARYHVISWSLMNDMYGKYSKTTCSEKDCEINHGYGKCIPRDKPPKKVSERLKDSLSIRTALGDRDKLIRKEIIDELEAYCNDEENIIYEDRAYGGYSEPYLSQKWLLIKLKQIREKG